MKVKKSFILGLCLFSLLGCSLSANIPNVEIAGHSKNETLVNDSNKQPPLTPISSPSNFPKESNKTIKFKLKSAIIRDSGDVVPIARTEFIFTVYNETELKKELVEKNKSIIEPKYDDKEFEKCEFVGTKKYCLPDGMMWYKKHTEWKDIVYKDLNKEIEKKSFGSTPVKIKTDLSGEATVELKEGTWYLTGSYSNSISSIYWTDIKIEVNDKLEKFELSNDNATSILNKNLSL